MRDGGARTVSDPYPRTGEPQPPISALAILDPERFPADPRAFLPELDLMRQPGADLGRRLSMLCRNRFAARTGRPSPPDVASADRRNGGRLAQLETQLRSAGALQRDLQSRPPAIRGVELSILQCPAGLVGGDVCEVWRIDDAHVGIAVADASGHDLAAGMLAMFVSRLMRSLGTGAGGEAQGPAEVLRGVNCELCRSRLEECHFVTAFYGVFDQGARVLRWSRAGAPHPMLIGGDGAARRLGGGGPLLGVIDDATFEVVETRLRPGETLLVFTDGLADFCGEPSVGSTGPRPGLGLEEPPRNARPIKERLADWDRALAASDRAGVGRDDVTVLALGVAPRPFSPPSRLVNRSGRPSAQPDRTSVRATF